MVVQVLVIQEEKPIFIYSLMTSPVFQYLFGPHVIIISKRSKLIVDSVKLATWFRAADAPCLWRNEVNLQLCLKQKVGQNSITVLQIRPAFPDLSSLTLANLR